MADGTYSEKLPCGGTLEVTRTGFRIRYYFPGPDNRSNGTFVNVEGHRLEEYIAAFGNNWNEYQRLKLTIPKGGEFQHPGEMGMTIRIGKFAEGVCLQSYHMPIYSLDGLNRVIESYEYAAKRAKQAREMLRAMEG